MKMKVNFGGISVEFKSGDTEGKVDFKQLDVDKEMDSEEFKAQLSAGVELVKSSINNMGAQAENLIKQWEESQIRIKNA